MKILDRLLGPASKHDPDLPYTYEARVPVVEGEELCNSYFSDTICGLIDYLEEHGIGPSQVSIYEIYQEEERPIDISLCVDAQGRWLHRPDLCRALQDHYKGHIYAAGCDFADRDRSGYGP
ncbi:MAG: hypothetical protein D6786_04960 [Gammaproteobacteria bacterium]|nr:MAG: hypothetical protein D6786_04960 [Gammaproteobacteria bacterium]